MDLSAGATRVDLALTKAETATWKAGDRLLLTGKIVTGRDAAHKRLTDLIAKGESCRWISRTASSTTSARWMPCATKWSDPPGPTTSRRMDKFMDTMLGKTGMLGSIGKSERGSDAVKVIKKQKGVHLIAIGGATYLVAKAIRAARVVAFKDLGMEAIHEFEVKDMPVTVAVDTNGNAVHSGRASGARKSEDPRQSGLRFGREGMQSVETDVVVVGGGGADCAPRLPLRRAIRACVSRSFPRSCRCAATRSPPRAARPAPSARTTVNSHRRYRGGGDWLCDQDVVEYFVAHCTEEMTQLEHWGCRGAARTTGTSTCVSSAA